MVKKDSKAKSPVPSNHYLRMLVLARERAKKDKKGRREKPGMGDLFKAFLYDGPAELVRIAEDAGIDGRWISYVGLPVDEKVEREACKRVLAHAHEEAAKDAEAEKVRVEDLFIALFRYAADLECRSVVREALLKQGLDPAAVLVTVCEGLAALPKQP